MAVLEAWAYRLPVLMTSHCNLPEGFAANAALELAPDAANLTEALKTLFEMTEVERRNMGESGRRLIEDRFTWPTVAASMRSVYAWILDQGSKPDCVLTH